MGGGVSPNGRPWNRAARSLGRGQRANDRERIFIVFSLGRS